MTAETITHETAIRPTTGTPAFNEIVPSFGELYANPAATQAMLDDAAFDVEAWLADGGGDHNAAGFGVPLI